MSDTQSPEIKISKDPAIAERVVTEQDKLQTKFPDSSPTSINQHARDRVASQLRMERVKTELEKAEELARVDPLTGLKNRRWFNEELDRQISHTLRTASPLWLLTIDFDQFKTINTQYGNHAGDEALKLISQLQARLEEPIARVGGDEFAQFLDENIDEDGIAAVVDRYIRRIADASREYLEDKTPALKEGEAPLNEFGLCIGVTKYATTPKVDSDRLEGEKSDQFIIRADMALKRAKVIPGKNKGVLALTTPTGVVFQEIPKPKDQITNG